MRDDTDRPVLEYLEDGTPMVWCVDWEGARVLRPVDEVLPPPPLRPAGTPACDPRRSLWHVPLLVLLALSLVAAFNEVQFRRIEQVSRYQVVEPQKHPIADYGWMLIGAATLTYMLRRRRAIALWDRYVQQGGDAAREDPAAVARAERAKTFVLVSGLGVWYLAMRSRRSRSRRVHPTDRAG